MTWEKIVAHLCVAVRGVPLGYSPLPADIPAWLRAQSPARNAAAELAARHFAEHLEWPPLDDPAVRQQLFLRVLFAMDTVVEMHARNAPLSPDSSRAASARLLGILLIDAWSQGHEDWTRVRGAPGGAGFDSRNC